MVPLKLSGNKALLVMAIKSWNCSVLSRLFVIKGCSAGLERGLLGERFSYWDDDVEHIPLFTAWG